MARCAVIEAHAMAHAMAWHPRSRRTACTHQQHDGRQQAQAAGGGGAMKPGRNHGRRRRRRHDAGGPGHPASTVACVALIQPVRFATLYNGHCRVCNSPTPPPPACMSKDDPRRAGARAATGAISLRRMSLPSFVITHQAQLSLLAPQQKTRWAGPSGRAQRTRGRPWRCKLRPTRPDMPSSRN